MRVVPACLWVLLLSVSLVSADPATILVRSGAASLITEEPDIRMVTETLTVDLYDWEAFVEADFLFRNEGGPREVLIAFPEIINQHHYDTWPRLRDVQFVVDGETMACERLPQDPDHPADAEEGFEFTCWYAAKVAFAPGQERRIVITYSHRHGSQFEGFRWFPYTFSTARAWKGSVDRITLIVNYHAGVSDVPVRLPEGYQHDAAARRLTWEWHDYDAQPLPRGGPRPTDPPEHMTLYWRPSNPQVQVSGTTTDLRASFSRTGAIVTFGTDGPGLPGYQAAPLADDPDAWTIEAKGRRLSVRESQSQATLDGQPFELSRPAEVFHDGFLTREACTLATDDLARAFGLVCTRVEDAHRLEIQP